MKNAFETKTSFQQILFCKSLFSILTVGLCGNNSNRNKSDKNALEQKNTTSFQTFWFCKNLLSILTVGFCGSSSNRNTSDTNAFVKKKNVSFAPSWFCKKCLAYRLWGGLEKSSFFPSSGFVNCSKPSYWQKSSHFQRFRYDIGTKTRMQSVSTIKPQFQTHKVKSGRIAISKAIVWVRLQPLRSNSKTNSWISQPMFYFCLCCYVLLTSMLEFVYLYIYIYMCLFIYSIIIYYYRRGYILYIIIGEDIYCTV